MPYGGILPFVFNRSKILGHPAGRPWVPSLGPSFLRHPKATRPVFPGGQEDLLSSAAEGPPFPWASRGQPASSSPLGAKQNHSPTALCFWQEECQKVRQRSRGPLWQPPSLVWHLLSLSPFYAGAGNKGLLLGKGIPCVHIPLLKSG